MSRLRAQIAAAGLRIVREELHVTRDHPPPAGFLADAVRGNGLTRDIFISNMEYVLAHPGSEAPMPVPDVDRYRPDDRRAVEALYRRVFGTDAADASRLRWEWQYRRNPNNPGGEPEIWIAREGPAIVGQYATMPVRLAVKGREVNGLVGHGRDGRAGAPAAGARRGAVPHVGSQRRRVARPRAVGRLVPAVPEAAVAGRRSGALPRQAAVAARLPPSALADADQPADLVADAGRWS